MGNTLSSCNCLEHEISFNNNALGLEQLLEQEQEELYSEQEEEEEEEHLQVYMIGCRNCYRYGIYPSGYCCLECMHSHRFRYEPFWKYFIDEKLNDILYSERIIIVQKRIKKWVEQKKGCTAIEARLNKVELPMV